MSFSNVARVQWQCPVRYLFACPSPRFPVSVCHHWLASISLHHRRVSTLLLLYSTRHLRHLLSGPHGYTEGGGEQEARPSLLHR